MATGRCKLCPPAQPVGNLPWVRSPAGLPHRAEAGRGDGAAYSRLARAPVRYSQPSLQFETWPALAWIPTGAPRTNCPFVCVCRWFRPALSEYRKQIRSVMRIQALWRGRELRHEARIRESEWLMSRLAPAAAQSQRRRLDRKTGARPKTPPGVTAAREMVERQAEEQWLELCSLQAAAAGRDPSVSEDIEYHRFCFSRIGWCGRMQTFPPQVSGGGSCFAALQRCSAAVLIRH